MSTQLEQGTSDLAHVDAIDDANPAVAEREVPVRTDTEAIGATLGTVPALPGAPPVADVVITLSLDDIAPDPAQARDEGADDELAESIQANGVQRPIEVRLNVNAGIGATRPYLIVDGERRWRGARKAGLTTITATVHEPADDGDRLLRQVIANDGKRLKPMEEARTWSRIMRAKGWKIQQLAQHLGRPKSTVSDRLALLDAPAPFQPLFASGVLLPAAAPIVRKYRDVPESILKGALDRLAKDDWYENVEGHVPVPLDRVDDDLDKELIHRFQPPLRELTPALEGEYTGPVCTVGKTRYATDAEAFDTVKLARAARSAAPSEVREPSPYELKEKERQRKERRAVELKRETRAAQFAALNPKLPTSLDAGWSLFLVRWMVKEIQQDDLRQACKALGLEPPKRGKFGGLDFDAAIVTHAESLGAAERTRLALSLLLSRDLSTSQYDNSPAQRFRDAAKLLKVDIDKVKPAAEAAPPPHVIGPRVRKAIDNARSRHTAVRAALGKKPAKKKATKRAKSTTTRSTKKGRR